MNDNKTCTNTRESTLQVSIYRMKNNRTNVSEQSIAKRALHISIACNKIQSHITRSSDHDLPEFLVKQYVMKSAISLPALHNYTDGKYLFRLKGSE